MYVCAPSKNSSGNVNSFVFPVIQYNGENYEFWQNSARIMQVLCCEKSDNCKKCDDGTMYKAYGNAIVPGIDRYPRKVHTRIGNRKLHKRSKIKQFLKVWIL